MTDTMQIINNEFQAKAFTNLLPDEFDIDILRDLYSGFINSSRIDALISLIYFLDCLDKKYTDRDSSEFLYVYDRVAKHVSQYLSDEISPLSTSSKYVEAWRSVLKVLKSNPYLLNKIANQKIHPNSDLVFLLEPLELSKESRDIINGKIVKRFIITSQRSMLNYDKSPQDLQDSIIKEAIRQFKESNPHYFNI